MADGTVLDKKMISDADFRKIAGLLQEIGIQLNCKDGYPHDVKHLTRYLEYAVKGKFKMLSVDPIIGRYLTTVVVGRGRKDKSDLAKMLVAAGYQIDLPLSRVLSHAEVCETERQISLYEVTVEELGFTSNRMMNQILPVAERLGFKACSIEAIVMYMLDVKSEEGWLAGNVFPYDSNTNILLGNRYCHGKYYISVEDVMTHSPLPLCKLVFEWSKDTFLQNQLKIKYFKNIPLHCNFLPLNLSGDADGRYCLFEKESEKHGSSPFHKYQAFNPDDEVISIVAS